MAEAVGLVAAAGQFLEQSITLVKLTKALCDKIKDTPKEVEKGLQDLEALRTIVEDIKNFATTQIQNSRRDSSECFETTIISCKAIINDIVSIFSDLNFKETDPIHHKTWKAIGGLSKQSEIRESFQRLGELKATLSLQLQHKGQTQNHGYFQAFNAKLDRIENAVQPGSNEEKCLQGLFVTDPLADRDGLITAKGQRTTGTCEWVTTTKEYQEWQHPQSGSSLLWISGPPAKGKTMISIFLSQLLEESKKDSTVIYFFCDNKVSSRNSATKVIRGLMFQLICKHSHLVTHVMSSWEVQWNALFDENSFESIWRIFFSMLRALEADTIYCVIDGLDEIDETLNSFLLKWGGMFQSKASEMPPCFFKSVILSREHPLCLPENLSSFPRIRIKEVDKDIGLYISDRVGRLAEKKGIYGEPLHHHIEKTFKERATGTFLWVSFMAEDLEGKTIDQIEACLDTLPYGLNAIYHRILSQIKSANKPIIAKMLTWITLAVEPLEICQLCEAIQISSTTNLSRVQLCLSYVKSCGHLLQVLPWPRQNADGNADANDKVTLIHQSVKDFLLDPSLDSLDFAIDEKQSHAEISKRLLEIVSTVCYYETDVSLTYYAARHWDDHMRALGDDCLLIVDSVPGFFSASSKARNDWWNYIFPYLGRASMTQLEMACFTGLLPLVRRLLRKTSLSGFIHGRKINKKSSSGQFTPLLLATMKGHDRIVKLLLDKGADVSPKVSIRRLYFTRIGVPKAIIGFRNLSALHIAILWERLECWKLLASSKSGIKAIEEDACLAQTHGQECLLRAAVKVGDEALCETLLETYHYDAAKITDGAGNNAFWWAVEDGNLDLARKLLNRWKVSSLPHSNIVNVVGRCTRIGAIAPMLHFLSDEVGIDIKGAYENGNTVLHCGDILVSTLRLYLFMGADPSICNSEGQTILHMAPLFLNHEFLWLVLQNGRVDINAKDDYEYTPMARMLQEDCKHFWSTNGLNKRMVCLLDFGADRNLVDQSGRTARQVAQELEPEPKQFLDPPVMGRTSDLLKNYTTVPINPTAIRHHFWDEESEGLQR